MPKISCAIITYNEEENIGKCLQAVRWCDEIIIVDSDSTDKTLEICKEFNCIINYKKFDGYGEQKRYAVSLAKNNWILNVDADEIVTDELRREIQDEFKKDKIDVNGFYLPRSLNFLGRKFKYGKESKEYYLRLFNKKYGNFNETKVHEKVSVEGNTKKLKGELLHFSYSSVHQYFEKFNHYTTNAAKELFEKGKKRNLLLTTLGFPLYFTKNFFINRNFLNGIQGFFWALFSSWYPVVKYAKLWALWNKK